MNLARQLVMLEPELDVVMISILCHFYFVGYVIVGKTRVPSHVRYTMQQCSLLCSLPGLLPIFDISNTNIFLLIDFGRYRWASILCLETLLVF